MAQGVSRGRDSLMQLSSTVTRVKAEKAGTDFAMLRLVTQLYLTLCDLMDYSPPDFPVPHFLLEFAQTHVP